MNRNRNWMVPLTGIAFVALVIIGFMVGGEPPDVDQSATEIVAHYTDDKDSAMIAAVLVTLGAVALVFFANFLRGVLRRAEGPEGSLSAVTLVGASILAIGLAIDSTITFALAETAEDIDPIAVQALAALWENDFMPMALGTMLFLLSTGISVVRHGALPSWLGWVAIVMALTAISPAGFVAFIGAGVWILIVSVMLAKRERDAATPAAPAAPAAPPPPAAPPVA